MCSYITETAEISGSAKGPQGWFRATKATVYYDHPFATPQANLPAAMRAPVNVNDAWHTARASDEVEGTAAQH